jgi:imidazolonepropionase-like amidohydrolase
MTEYTVHTSALFDPKAKQVRSNISITVNSASGRIVRIFERDVKGQDFSAFLTKGDVDLRGKYVLPGLVDAHTHVFLHSYE